MPPDDAEWVRALPASAAALPILCADSCGRAAKRAEMERRDATSARMGPRLLQVRRGCCYCCLLRYTAFALA